MFGEDSFFSRNFTDHGTKASNVVSLVYVRFEDFSTVLDKY
jgi:hypothetical protein